MNRGKLINGFNSPPMLVPRADARGTSKELPPRHKFLSALPRCGFRSQWSAIPSDVVQDSVGKRSAKPNKALYSIQDGLNLSLNR
jgi:hypothetical protein